MLVTDGIGDCVMVDFGPGLLQDNVTSATAAKLREHSATSATYQIFAAPPTSDA